ncbi:hypothetical protein G5B30_09195 [Sphingobacterium sp. SGG-5]|uniref:immunoglobulin domain-containing protein n=1 Tax=Sphingobacterium sp. SGG-5 TaxID=2710881 RepID=UPI0013EACA55|nr:hypothetical protein [Sphingobacterium sp. SGG-5]NGM62088.1 hypothetical protein [Sphingobacterium sp. SGG-5]
MNRLCFLQIFCGLLSLWPTVQVCLGQRIYADTQKSDATFLLASVSNPAEAVDLPDTTNFSTLNVTLGALGLIYARQNLQFIDNPKPTRYSPIIAKIGSNSSLLTLLGGFAVQRTKGGINSTVAPGYSGSELLNLLNLFGSGQIGTLVFLPDGNDFDGIRFEVNSLLNLALTANYYYAFYIAMPILSESNLTVCEGANRAVTISNFQPGYTYQLYTTQLGGTQVGSDITTNTFIIQDNWNGSYWLEAREGNIYPSGRTPLTITMLPRPGKPHLTIRNVIN